MICKNPRPAKNRSLKGFGVYDLFGNSKISLLFVLQLLGNFCLHQGPTWTILCHVIKCLFESLSHWSESLFAKFTFFFLTGIFLARRDVFACRAQTKEQSPGSRSPCWGPQEVALFHSFREPISLVHGSVYLSKSQDATLSLNASLIFLPFLNFHISKNKSDKTLAGR